MSGPVPKPAELRHRTNKPKEITDLSVVKSEPMPRPPADLSENGLAEWEELWRSTVASSYDRRTDIPALHRLFELRERVVIYEAIGHENTVVKGSTGQLSLHPLLKQASTLRAEILALEDRFGLSPKAKASLGVTFGQAALTAVELNKLTKGNRGRHDVDDENGQAESPDEWEAAN